MEGPFPGKAMLSNRRVLNTLSSIKYYLAHFGDFIEYLI
jgi:hypothetical protein